MAVDIIDTKSSTLAPSQGPSDSSSAVPIPRIQEPASHVTKRASPDRRSHARTHLLATLKDRGLKGPLKWSKRVSEVNIPNYRTECRSLGDPLLFTRTHQLPTSLAKREEFLMDTPLATFSYHCSSSPGGSSRRTHKTDQPMIGKEVTLSELRRLMPRTAVPTSSDTRHASLSPSARTSHSHHTQTPTTKSASSELIDSSGLKISIQESETSTTLPQINITIKREPTKSAVSRLRHTFKSPSWGPEQSHQWRSAKKNRKQDLDSVHELLINADSAENENKPIENQPREQTRIAKNRHRMDLKALGKQPNIERTREWVYKSPLDTAVAMESAAGQESEAMRLFKSQKPTRRVRFGGGEWLYKDRTYMFD